MKNTLYVFINIEAVLCCVVCLRWGRGKPVITGQWEIRTNNQSLCLYITIYTVPMGSEHLDRVICQSYENNQHDFSVSVILLGDNH